MSRHWTFLLLSLSFNVLLLFHHYVVLGSLLPHGLQHVRGACPSLCPRVCSDSCSLSRWCHPTISSSVAFLLLPSVFPSIRVFSNDSAFHIRWPKYWSFNFSISRSNEYSGLISFGYTGWISLQSKGFSRVSSNTTVQKHQFFNAQLSLESNSHYWKNHSFD